MSTQTKNKPIQSKVRTAAKPCAVKPAVKKSPAPKAEAPVLKGELFIVNGAKKLDAAHCFKKSVSPIYGVEEYSWTGVLAAGEMKFVRPDGKAVPTNDIYNSGYTLVGNAMKLFAVENALVECSHTSEDQCYNYGNPRTVLKYVGKAEKHTIYVRIYDNATGEKNDRWVTLSIE